VSEDQQIRQAVYLGVLDAHKQQGLTKRELFAAMAMQGQLANSKCPKEYDMDEPVILADALLKALEESADE